MLCPPTVPIKDFTYISSQMRWIEVIALKIHVWKQEEMVVLPYHDPNSFTMKCTKFSNQYTHVTLFEPLYFQELYITRKCGVVTHFSFDTGGD